MSLKDHPFAVEAYFDSSLVLTYAIAKEELQGLIPECLELDTFNDKYAFIAAAVVKTKELRPKGFPKFMGNSFILIGFRIFVRYTTNDGKRLRGLYILKSETDKMKMSILGNVFTHYNYTKIDISYKTEGDLVKIKSVKGNLEIEAELNKKDTALPANSPFADWKEARRFAGPLPFTFTYNNQTKEVLIIEGVRENWIPAPVAVLKSKIGFIDDKGFKDIQLANAFINQNIPYYWKKGRREIWKG